MAVPAAFVNGCYLNRASRDLELVLGFARLEPDAIREGVAELRELLRDHRREASAQPAEMQFFADS